LPGHPLGGAHGTAIGAGSLWTITCAADCTDQGARGNVVRIDLSTGRMLASIPITSPQSLTFGEGAVWAVDFWDSMVLRVDPGTNRVVARIRLTLPFALRGDRRFLPIGIAVGEGSVWVDTSRGPVARIDPRTNRVVGMIRLAPDVPGGLAAGQGAVWVAESLAEVARIDPASNKVTKSDKFGTCGQDARLDQVSTGAGAVWAAGGWATRGSPDVKLGLVQCPVRLGSGTLLVRIDPATNRIVATVPVQRINLDLLGAGREAVWLSGGDQAWWVDPSTNRVGGRTTLPPQASTAVAPDGMLWILDRAGRLSKARPISSPQLSPDCGVTDTAGKTYGAHFSLSAGKPGDTVVVAGPTLRGEDGRYAPALRIEVWWNTNVPRSQAPYVTPLRPGPVLLLAAENELDRCNFSLRFSVPPVRPGPYRVETFIYWEGGYSPFGGELFSVTP
jgi:hypothetical protein